MRRSCAYYNFGLWMYFLNVPCFPLWCDHAWNCCPTFNLSFARGTIAKGLLNLLGTLSLSITKIFAKRCNIFAWCVRSSRRNNREPARPTGAKIFTQAQEELRHLHSHRKDFSHTALVLVGKVGYLFNIRCSGFLFNFLRLGPFFRFSGRIWIWIQMASKHFLF